MRLTQARLKALLHYDPETGVWTWRSDQGRGRQGERAGRPSERGHRVISIDNKLYKECQLAWLYSHGILPSRMAFADGDKSNCRLANLRDFAARYTKRPAAVD